MHQQKQSTIHPAFIYGLILVCAVGVFLGYQQTARTRPQRMKQWVALRLDFQPPSQPGFYKLLEGYRLSGRMPNEGVSRRPPPRPPHLASASLEGEDVRMSEDNVIHKGGTVPPAHEPP